MGAIPYFRVISREYMAEVLEEQELQLSGIGDESSAVKAGRLLNAQYILIGSFQVFEETLQVNTKVLAVETGEIVAQAHTFGPLADFYVVQNSVYPCP